MVNKIKDKGPIQTEFKINVSKRILVIRILQILVFIFIFFLSIHLISVAFRSLSDNIIGSIIFATSNPFIGLFIGLLITALIQSSSTSTSIIVAIVASGTLSFQNAIPMIMGANIGTTITSTVVSLGYIAKKKEFRKAISAGTLHDFFNILTALILFPLEIQFGILSNAGQYIASLISISENGGGKFFFVDFSLISPISNYIFNLIGNHLIVILLGLIALFTAIKILSNLLYKYLIGETKHQLNNFIFKSKKTAFGWGVVFTAAVQSSSITTPLVVPLVATGKVSLKKAFPFIMGANIGTTITALLAALYKSDAALSVAIVHLLFNLTGVLLFFPLTVLQKIPVYLATQLGKATKRYRIIGFAYILFTFFLLPFTLIYFNKEDDPKPEKSPSTEISTEYLPE
jgi:solute carrier family 34 (sodium-dependent phosphate cotransporter)